MEPVRIPEAADFAADFFNRHSNLARFAPKRVLDGKGAGGHHPEAYQKGDDIYLLPKFWRLDADIRDWTFAHELGHFVLSQYGLDSLIDILSALGVDAWDTSTLPYAQSNMDEAFADCFADYFLNYAEVKRRYSKWCSAVHVIEMGY